MRSSTGSSFPVVLLASLAIFRAAHGREADFAIPSVPARLAPERSPPPFADIFWKRHGPGFAVHWDDALRTPRLLTARDPLMVLPPPAEREPGPEGVAAAALYFLDGEEDFLGARADMLDGPRVTRVGDLWLLSYRQRAGGIPVRGSSLRLLLHPDGRLVSLAGYLLRDTPRDRPRLLPEEEARARAALLFGARILEGEAEWVFPSDSPRDARAAWCFTAELPDSSLIEVFLDADGKELGRRPLAQGFGLCDQEPRKFTAYGSSFGLCPDPEDLYATAVSPLDAYPIAGSIVRNNEGWEDLVLADGTWTLNVDLDFGVYWMELAYGICGERPAAGVRRIFDIRRPDLPRSCDPSSPSIKLQEVPGPVQNGVGFNLNLDRSPPGAWELLVYHQLRRFHDDLAAVRKRNEIQAMDFGPLAAVVPSVEQRILSPDGDPLHPASYTPHGRDSRLCLSRVWALESGIWYPATIVHHEYAHHLLYEGTGSSQAGDLLEGLADAIAAYRNRNPRIGFLAEDLAGPIGFSLDPGLVGLGGQPIAQITRELRERGVPPREYLTGAALWRLFVGINNPELAENLLHRWIALHAVKHASDRAFEDSPVLVEELLVAADAEGPGALPGADGDLRNGAPFDTQIVAAFDDWVEELRFIRGDANGSGVVDLSDAVSLLTYLFDGGRRPPCFQACDVDSSTTVDLSDPIFLLGYLFLSGPVPREPYPACGAAADRSLWCGESTCF